MPDPLPLWPDETLAHVTLRLMPAAEPTDAVVLVLPGGGYNTHADHEAEPIAQRFVDGGLNGAVLRYRLGSAGHRHPEMIHDALRAIRMLRAHGWSNVAVLGFSAGGHLAATAATRFNTFDHADADDLRDTHSARPDAAILCYPVIDLIGIHAHSGSADNLLGEHASQQERHALSLSKHVHAGTPPTFLWHTNQDAGVPPTNSIHFALACREHGVPIELHIYERGRHGLGQGLGERGNPPEPGIAGWVDLAIAFAKRHLVEDVAAAQSAAGAEAGGA